MPEINIHKCRRCDTLVFFALYLKTGKTNPLEWEPAEDGNCRVSDYHLPPFVVYEILTGDALGSAWDEGETLFISHFARCEFARRFRARLEARKSRTKELSPKEAARVLFGGVTE